MSTKRIVLWCLMTAVAIVGVAAWMDSSISRLKRHLPAGKCFSVGFALEMYVEKYGKLPPIVTVGPKNEPYHSWRILLMEFMDTDLYRAYDFDLPWNHEHNRKVALLRNHFRPPSEQFSRVSEG